MRKQLIALMLKIKIHKLLKCDNSSNFMIIFIKTKKMQPNDTKKHEKKHKMFTT